jgi:hypothetical protein
VSTLIGHYNYWIVVFLMMTGFYIVIAQGNLIKKVVRPWLWRLSCVSTRPTGPWKKTRSTNKTTPFD